MVCWIEDSPIAHPLSYHVVHPEKSDHGHEIQIRHCLLGILLNEVLGEITGKPDYRFNPKAIMADKNGAIFCGIKEVLRLDFMMSEAGSCQMHFKIDVHKA